MHSDDGNQSDEDVNPVAHQKLLKAIGSLGKNQHIRKPTRSEPSLARDEFHLVKPQSHKARDSLVTVGDLVKVLKKTSKHIEVGKQLKNTQNLKKVLKKPLEKPVAERIQRAVGYEKAKKALSRWDAVVERNRISEHQVFPLDYEEVHVQMTVPKKPPGLTIKTDLMVEMEAVDNKLKALKGLQNENTADESLKVKEKLTRDELISRRKELAYLRVRESQKSAKARLQNKIKSKKFHKYLKREKLKEQIKEFELLQKSNPEAALEKLENIEKNRVMERASLRHKNTGTWAKNLQIRAKYDKDVRKDLTEQLTLSRSLTQKQNNDDDEKSDIDDENDKELAVDYDPFNPWVKHKKTVEQSSEISDFVSGYRKYWTERNKNEKAIKLYKATDGIVLGSDDEKVVTSGNKDQTSYEEQSDKESNVKDILKSEKKNRKNKSKVKSFNESSWSVEDILNETTDRNIDDLFDSAEQAIQTKVENKLSDLKKILKNEQKNVSKRSKKKIKFSNVPDLSFKKKSKLADADEELLETAANVPTAALKPNIKQIDSIHADDKLIENKIDPTKFEKIKPKFLQTALPDMVNSEDFFEDQSENLQAQMTIAEAFEDDDIVADFERDREDDQKKSANADIDLTLPGWGSWAGCGIQKQNKTKRLILKFAKDAPRRDENRGKVHINEDGNTKLKQHLVSDLPFPFKSVKDYEASIRAPIGRSFVPETAFRMLTRPAVVTKLGAIIDPMDEEFLNKPSKRPRTVVDKRISKLNKNKVKAR